MLTAQSGPPIQTNEPDETYPTTAYTIAAEQTIKGDLLGNFAVRQVGGLDAQGVLQVIEDDALLTVGSRYLIVGTMVDGVLNLAAGGFSHHLADDLRSERSSSRVSRQLSLVSRSPRRRRS